MKALFLLAALLPVTLGATPEAAARTEGYRFRTIVDQGIDPFSVGCPAINRKGDVAFRAFRDVGGVGVDGLFLARNRRLRTIVDRESAGFAGLGLRASLNDRGQVAFGAILEDATLSDALFVGQLRRPLITIAQSEPGPFSAINGSDAWLNNAGQVAFTASLDDGDAGLFVGDGGLVTTIFLASTSEFRGTPSGASINDSGQIAFGAQRDDFSEGIFLFTGGAFVTIADGSGPVLFPSSQVLNNAGVMAFTGFIGEGSGVFTGSGGAVTTVADTSGPYAFIGAPGPAINDDGTVAFNALLDEGGFGIFTGPDPVADRVIAAGDSLGGATVFDPQVCSEGINERGEIAFLALLDDGRFGVFVATPRGR